MKKRILAIVLVLAMGVVFLAGCTDSGQGTVVQEVDYDPVAEVAKYELGELSEADKGYVIQMGYNDCDHMVAAIIGDLSGIYEALELEVVVTKTGKIMEAMASGEMAVGYQGIAGAIRAVNEGAPLFMASANHLGGSRYLLVSNEIKTGQDMIGKKLAISAKADTNPEWIRWANELDIPIGPENYEIVQMSQKDSLFALKAGEIDGITVCDPYASHAEFEGVGHIMGTGWGAHDPNDPDSEWGMCCIYTMSEEFRDQHPELANRLVLAHGLSIKYLYEHPYNAAMMFAQGFGTPEEVGLKTVYMKTVAEGRTITWQFGEKNLENYMNYYKEYNIPAEETPNINDLEKFMSTDLLESCGIEDFDSFVEASKIDEEFPVGMTYDEWLVKAKVIDGIEDEVAKK